jgi:hypothetical protein
MTGITNWVSKISWGDSMDRWRVVFTVEVEAESEEAAYSDAAHAVEGFPPQGVEVEYDISRLDEAKEN